VTGAIQTLLDSSCASSLREGSTNCSTKSTSTCRDGRTSLWHPNSWTRCHSSLVLITPSCNLRLRTVSSDTSDLKVKITSCHKKKGHKGLNPMAQSTLKTSMLRVCLSAAACVRTILMYTQGLHHTKNKLLFQLRNLCRGQSGFLWLTDSTSSKKLKNFSRKGESKVFRPKKNSHKTVKRREMYW
jgi:hypothetical protein